MSRSTSNSNTNSNPHNSTNNSSNVSRSRSPYGRPISQQHNTQTQGSTNNQRSNVPMTRDRSSFPERIGPNAFYDVSRPSTPSLVYIVTSNFISQTTNDGVRLSESDIVGFQILAVFARIEDANAYAEHECEEIDVGVRRRRRRMQGVPVDIEEGDGIRASAIVGDDGTISWIVENVGHIVVEQWVVQ